MVLYAKLCKDVQSLTPKLAGIMRNPRVDILAATALIELLHPVKYAIFILNQGLQTPCSGHMMLNEKYYQQESLVMNPVVLIILAISKDYIDKIVMLPGKGTRAKGTDKKLPGWLVAAASRTSEETSGSVVEMIQNWNDDKKEIFDFRLNSIRAS